MVVFTRQFWKGPNPYTDIQDPDTVVALTWSLRLHHPGQDAFVISGMITTGNEQVAEKKCWYYKF